MHYVLWLPRKGKVYRKVEFYTEFLIPKHIFHVLLLQNKIKITIHCHTHWRSLTSASTNDSKITFWFCVPEQLRIKHDSCMEVLQCWNIEILDCVDIENNSVTMVDMKSVHDI